MCEKLVYIIQSKNYNVARKSSSGGTFAELARYVFSQNGVVFGCTMERAEEGFDVKHIYIEEEKDLYKLQGSKYVQSSLGNTIKEAKSFLEQKRLVLFSGTPCQIAGLKAFLKQDYDNLITLDLSCTGTPSQEIFNAYIKFLEKKYNNKILRFEFRNKEKMGWSCGNALITFENGKQKIISNNVSSYLNLFITKRLQNKNCQNCKYSGLNRFSDITLADAWGIEKEYPELLETKFERDKGVSLVLINNANGEKFLDRIKENLVIEPVNINKLKNYNYPLTENKKDFETKFLDAYKNYGYEKIDKLFKKDLGIKYYYYILKNHSPAFIKNFVKLFLPKSQKADCLLMTGYYYENYGSLLAAYSLYQTIRNMGLSAKLVHYGNLNGFGKMFVKKHMPLTKRCLNYKSFKDLNKISDIFILGSDNLINLNVLSFYNFCYNLLSFTSPEKKRIMISGSLGSWNGKTKDTKEHDYIKYLLNRFDYVSTREEYGKQVFKNEFDIDADWINDPVFYLERKEYENLIKNVKHDYANKIMQYVLYSTEKSQKIVDFYKQKTKLDIVKFDGNNDVRFYSSHKNKTVEDWLSAIINSELIVTDSFHCTAFALIFNKPVVCIKNTHATVRFTSLFKRLGIDIPLVESVDDLENINLDYNKEQVNKVLCDIRNFALGKIEQAIINPLKEHIKDETMEKYNTEIMKNCIPWFKRSKLFYYLIITPFVLPIIHISKDLKRICK